MIELDVHLSKDGVVVVTHDETIARVTSGRRKERVDEMTASALTRVRLGKDGNGRMPTLERVIRRFATVDVTILIEMKAKVFAKSEAFSCGSLFNKRTRLHSSLSQELCDILERHRTTRCRFIVQSFFKEYLQEVHARLPDVECHLLAVGHLAFPPRRSWTTCLWTARGCRRPRSDWMKRLRENGVSAVNVMKHFCTARFVKIAHANGLKVFVWTCDDEPTMRSLLAMHVDGIITNRPRLLHTIMFGSKPVLN